jgi:ribosomal protein S19
MQLLEKTEAVKTHLQDISILPETVGSMVAISNHETFSQLEIKARMISQHWGEFSITYSL